MIEMELLMFRKLILCVFSDFMILQLFAEKFYDLFMFHNIN